jgi:hypothetical protein
LVTEARALASFLEFDLDQGLGGLSISQSTQSPDYWNLVVNKFQDTIPLMQ